MFIWNSEWTCGNKIRCSARSSFSLVVEVHIGCCLVVCNTWRNRWLAHVMNNIWHEQASWTQASLLESCRMDVDIRLTRQLHTHSRTDNVLSWECSKSPCFQPFKNITKRCDRVSPSHPMPGSSTFSIELNSWGSYTLDWNRYHRKYEEQLKTSYFYHGKIADISCYWNINTTMRVLSLYCFPAVNVTKRQPCMQESWPEHTHVNAYGHERLRWR